MPLPFRPPVAGFDGRDRALSNFYENPISYFGFSIPTNEHGFQLAKCMDRDDMIQISRVKHPRRAKELGRQVRLRPDWEEVKDGVMLELQILKFGSAPRLRRRLLETGSRVLIEVNTWGDHYWGTDPQWFGENRLGLALMKTRAFLGGVGLRCMIEGCEEATSVHRVPHGSGFNLYLCQEHAAQLDEIEVIL